MRAEEFFHARHGMHRNAVGTHHLAAKMDEPRVMPDVRVREQNAINAPGQFRKRCVQPPSLAWKTRRALDEPALAGDGVDDSKARGVAPVRGVAQRFFAAILLTTDLWKSAILRRAKHDGKRPASRFGTKSRRRKRRADEELASVYFQVLTRVRRSH